MPTLTVIYGETVKTVEATAGALLGDAIKTSELPLEQPCAGRGTCGKCKVLVEAGLAPPASVEAANLTEGELAVGSRLACRARVRDDAQVTLAPSSFTRTRFFGRATVTGGSGRFPWGWLSTWARRRWPPFW